MILTRLRAQNYRNITSCDVAFGEGVNLLLGDNAQGKTNAVECIYAFARGRSFRGASDQNLVRIGAEGFSTGITFRDATREQNMTYEFADGVRRRTRNGVPIRRLAEALGIFRAVLFFPEHLQIVKGGPAERREFLNVALSQTDPVYVGWHAAYNRILESRNCLLRAAKTGGWFDRGELDAWSEKLAEAAGEIYIRRRRYVAGFAPLARDILYDLSGGREHLGITYVADVEADSAAEAAARYREALFSDLKRESAAGCTLTGIHRDDLHLTLGNLAARDFASQGQQRSVVLALKMAEGEYSRCLMGEYPVFLFDDVLSELDESRRSYVLGDIGTRQFIMTACEKTVSCGNFREIRVEGGQYVSAYRER